MAVTAAAADSTIAFYLHLQSYSRRCTSSGSTASSSVSRSMVESSGSRLSSLQSPSTRRGSGFWGDGLGFVGTAMERAAVGTTKTKTTTKTMTKTGGESKKGERSRRESEMKQTEKKRWRFSAPPSTTTETAASKSPPSTTTTLESHFPSPLSSAPASSSSEKTSSLPWPSASPLEPKPAKMRFLKCITHTFSSTKNTTPAPAPFPSPPSPLPHIHSSFSSFSPSASASSLSPSTFSSSFATHTHTHTHPSSRSRSPSTSSSSSSTGTSIIYTPISFRLPFFRRTPTEPQQEYKLVPLPVRPGVLRDRWFLRAVMVPVGSRRSRKGMERMYGMRINMRVRRDMTGWEKNTGRIVSW
ncbi:hypothetical protein EX30DRAFT_133536 [Ascodesmis nigricans]|uniref:Uncharacterized protein n=1 Tax=Ascodesmis nigricans TaxID=341454 RepID=A0A4S2MNM1_9PEZI|nr:hypothetical protein EX30DRAFT_133536 [Ascodesmis nigricans]